MDSRTFQTQRERHWRTLEERVRERKASFHTADDLDGFAQLYRSTANDLSYAQTYFPEDPVTKYLNTLVSAAHTLLYREGDSGFRTIVSFFTHQFPALFRQLGVYILVSSLVFFAAGLFGYIEVQVSPAQAYALLPPSMMDQIRPGQVGPHTVDAPLISSMIMTHNILVCLIAFVGGISLGLYTLYSLWQNGLIIGVLAAVFAQSHKSLIFWSLIVPHGVTELLAIFMSGGAGLVFAHRLISPGQLRRLTAIQLGLRQAVALMLGVAPMLVIAGSIEGFLTPSFAPLAVKFTIAGATFVLWGLYFGCLGRRTRTITV